MHTPSLVKCQRINQMDEMQTTDQHMEKMSSTPLDQIFQRSSEEQSISNKMPIKVDVSVKFVPKHPKTKYSAINVDQSADLKN